MSLSLSVVEEPKIPVEVIYPRLRIKNELLDKVCTSIRAKACPKLVAPCVEVNFYCEEKVTPPRPFSLLRFFSFANAWIIVLSIDLHAFLFSNNTSWIFGQNFIFEGLIPDIKYELTIAVYTGDYLIKDKTYSVTLPENYLWWSSTSVCEKKTFEWVFFFV